eukprot:3924884-Amphidinium_carterae.1
MEQSGYIGGSSLICDVVAARMPKIARPTFEWNRLNSENTPPVFMEVTDITGTRKEAQAKPVGDLGIIRLHDVLAVCKHLNFALGANPTLGHTLDVSIADGGMFRYNATSSSRDDGCIKRMEGIMWPLRDRECGTHEPQDLPKTGPIPLTERGYVSQSVAALNPYLEED